MWFEEDGAKESLIFWDGEEEGGMKKALRESFGFTRFSEYDADQVNTKQKQIYLGEIGGDFFFL